VSEKRTCSCEVVLVEDLEKLFEYDQNWKNMLGKMSFDMVKSRVMEFVKANTWKH